MDDFKRYTLGAPRSLGFGLVMGGVVGSLAGGIDAVSAASRAKPRPPSNEVTRAALRAAATAGGASGLFFGLYQATKCVLFNSRFRHGLAEVPTVAVAAAAAAVPTFVLARPNPAIAGMLVLLDNSHLILGDRNKPPPPE